MAYLGNKPATGENNAFRILDDISSHVVSFNGSSASVVSLANDTITITDDKHRYVTGQRITYGKGGGTVITGLTDATAYYVIRDSATTIQLATSASNATNGVAVNLTGLGVGTAHTITLAFDGVNTKFKATYENGTQDPLITRAAQLVLSLNGVIQQPVDSTTPSTGFGIDHTGTIIFSTAPASTDNFWGHVLASNTVTFDISDNTIDNFTGNGSLVNFTLSKIPPDNRNILVTLDGVVQYPSDNSTTRAYTLSENELQFVSAPASGVAIQVRHIGFAGASGGGGGGVTGFYGRTGNVVLKNTDNILVNNATFSGNVSIAKTLTYMDVTNIDAVGIVTFQDDVQYNGSGAGISSAFWDKSANEFKFKDGVKLSFGDSQDLQLYHSGAHSFIKDAGTGMLKICADMIDFRNAADNATLAYAQEGNKFELFYAGNSKLSTTGYGVTVFGTTETQKLNVTGISTFNDAVTIVDTKKLNIGTDGDVEIYFDGSSASRIDSIGTGRDLEIRSDRFLKIAKKGNGALGFQMLAGDEVGLYHAGNKKINTTSGGINVTGKAIIDGVDVTQLSNGATNNGIFLNAGDTGAGNRPYLDLKGSGTSALGAKALRVYYDNGGTEAFSVAYTGDIVGGHFTSGGNLTLAHKIIHAGDTDTFIEFDTDTITFDTAGSERLRITSTGVVSINDSTPETFITFGVKNHTGANACQALFHGADMAQIILRDETGGTNTKCTTLRNDQGALKIGTHNDSYGGFSEKLSIASTGLIYVNGDATGGRIDATAGDGSMTFSDGNGRQTLKITTMASGQSAAHAFDANGTLCIGAVTPTFTSPTPSLNIEKTSTGSGPVISLYNGQSANAASTCEILVRQNYRGANKIIFGRENANNWQASATSAASYMAFETNSAGTLAERLRITSDGKVGINEPSPGSQLVVRAATDDNPNIKIYRNSGGGDVGSITWASSQGTNARINWRGGSGNMGMSFHTSAAGNDGSVAERLRITSTGQLQATGAADVRLTLGSSGTAGTNDSVHIRADSADLKFMAASGGNTIFEENGTERLRITSDGAINNTYVDEKRGIAPIYRDYCTLTTSWQNIARITGYANATMFRFVFEGQASGTFWNGYADIMVGHYRQYKIKLHNGGSIPVSVRLFGNGSGTCDLQVKTESGNSGTLGFNIIPSTFEADGTVVFTNSGTMSDSNLEIQGVLGTVSKSYQAKSDDFKVWGSASSGNTTEPAILKTNSSGAIIYFEHFFNCVKGGSGNSHTVDQDIVTITGIGNFHQASFTADFGVRLQGQGDQYTRPALWQTGVNRFNGASSFNFEEFWRGGDTAVQTYANLNVYEVSSTEYRIRMNWPSGTYGSSFASGKLSGYFVNDQEDRDNITFAYGRN